MAPKSSPSTQKGSSQKDDQTQQSSRVYTRMRAGSSSQTEMEIFDQRVLEAHSIRATYEQMRRDQISENHVSRFLYEHNFENDAEFRRYLSMPLRTIIPAGVGTSRSSKGRDQPKESQGQKRKRSSSETVHQKDDEVRRSQKGAEGRRPQKDTGAKETSDSRIGDDDEFLYNNFEKVRPRLVKHQDFREPFFMNQSHFDRFKALQKRGVMSHRVFQIKHLNSLGIHLKDSLDDIRLTNFVGGRGHIFPDLVAYFYSSLTFMEPNSLFYKIDEEMYHLRVDELAQIMGVRKREFMPIKATPQEAYSYLTGDDNFSRHNKAHISYEKFPLKHILMHKVVIESLRPKASSKTDISRFEAKLMYALLKGYDFSPAHVVLLHMYRTVQKSRGQLPYAALIYNILKYHKVQIPGRFCKNEMPVKEGGEDMLHKMGFKFVRGKWLDRNKHEVSVEFPPSDKSALRKKVPATKGDRLYINSDSSSSAEYDTFSGTNSSEGSEEHGQATSSPTKARSEERMGAAVVSLVQLSTEKLVQGHQSTPEAAEPQNQGILDLTQPKVQMPEAETTPMDTADVEGESQIQDIQPLNTEVPAQPQGEHEEGHTLEESQTQALCPVTEQPAEGEHQDDTVPSPISSSSHQIQGEVHLSQACATVLSAFEPQQRTETVPSPVPDPASEAAAMPSAAPSAPASSSHPTQPDLSALLDNLKTFLVESMDRMEARFEARVSRLEHTFATRLDQIQAQIEQTRSGLCTEIEQTQSRLSTEIARIDSVTIVTRTKSRDTTVARRDEEDDEEP